MAILTVRIIGLILLVVGVFCAMAFNYEYWDSNSED